MLVTIFGEYDSYKFFSFFIFLIFNYNFKHFWIIQIFQLITINISFIVSSFEINFNSKELNICFYFPA